MKQKLIMENWRRFLIEQADKGVRLDPKDVLMRVSIDPDNDASMIMYKLGEGETPEDQFDGLSIIGSVWLESLKYDGPCLQGKGRRPAWHITAVHTSNDHRSVGYGEELYGFAFLVAEQNNASLTSDKNAGTKPDAMKIWDKFEKTASTYTKVKTDSPHENEQFDYDGVTPDPNDDCPTEMDADDPDNATNFAFVKKDAGKFESLMKAYEQNHLEFMKKLLPTQWVTEADFEAELVGKDFESFKDAFPETQ